MKEKIIPIASVIIGILAFLLTGHYLRSREKDLEALKQRIYEGARKVQVVGAANDIPAGTVIKRDDLGKLSIFASAAPDGIIELEKAAMLPGRKTQFEIKANKPIIWAYIEGGAPEDQGLASMVKPGMRALSLSVAGPAAVSGMVRPNDRVDVLGTFSLPSKTMPGELETVTLTVLQDVTVLATGQQTSRVTVSARRASSYNSVTLEVTPRESELLVFAQQMKGRLILSLRNPSDASFETDLPEIDFKQLESTLPELNQYRQQNIRHKRSL